MISLKRSINGLPGLLIETGNEFSDACLDERLGGVVV